jgi:hypothetical protein
LTTAARSLQISKRAAAKGLTLEQERFNFLIHQIEKIRKDRVELELRFQKFRQSHSEKLHPLRAALSATCRESVLVMDRLLNERGWTRWEMSSISGLLCDTAEALLAANPHDEEIKALFRKHSRIDFDAARQDDLKNLKEHAEIFTGLDLGDDEGIETEEDLIQRVYEEMAAREAADEEKKESRRNSRRKSASEQRIEENARLAKQSLREVYRKLASALHPDREADPVRREQKNALMQRINQAYAANDLLTLFETQMEIEQIEAQEIGKASTERMKQYNRLLADQLATLKAQVKDLEGAFRSDFGLPPTSEISARTLSLFVQRRARHFKSELAQQKQFLEVLNSKAAMKRWLKQQRRIAEGGYFRDDEAE